MNACVVVSRLKAPAAELATLFDVSGLPPVPPRYNIAPGTPVLVVRQGGRGREAASLRWGLVPSWASDPAIGDRLANARSETAADKPAFREAFRSRRCLIPASGFYEWQKQGSGKAPFCVRPRDDHPLALAGLWDCSRARAGQPLETCTVLTTDANELLQPIHERMPVIISPSDFTTWLEPHALLSRVRQLLRPCPADRLTCYPVDRRVNDPRHDDLRCLEPGPASARSPDATGWLFGNPA